MFETLLDHVKLIARSNEFEKKWEALMIYIKHSNNPRWIYLITRMDGENLYCFECEKINRTEPDCMVGCDTCMERDELVEKILSKM